MSVGSTQRAIVCGAIFAVALFVVSDRLSAAIRRQFARPS
jgi:hypothetical protein